MALTDWDFFFGLFGGTAGIQGINPILGSASLETEATGFQVVQGQRDIGFSRGFLKGKIRTLVRLNSIGAGIIPQAGLFCMSSTENIATTSGACYAMSIHPGTTANVIVKKFPSSGLGSSPTVLDSGDKTFSVSDIIPLEFEWNLDIPGIGGIVLIARTGDVGDLDFTNLSTIITVTDFSPFLTSFAEGIYNHSGSATAGNWSWEQTEIFSGV